MGDDNAVPYPMRRYSQDCLHTRLESRVPALQATGRRGDAVLFGWKTANSEAVRIKVWSVLH
jgi:hypothetical protein